MSLLHLEQVILIFIFHCLNNTIGLSIDKIFTKNPLDCTALKNDILSDAPNVKLELYTPSVQPIVNIILADAGSSGTRLIIVKSGSPHVCVLKQAPRIQTPDGQGLLITKILNKLKSRSSISKVMILATAGGREVIRSDSTFKSKLQDACGGSSICQIKVISGALEGALGSLASGDSSCYLEIGGASIQFTQSGVGNVKIDTLGQIKNYKSFSAAQLGGDIILTNYNQETPVCDRKNANQFNIASCNSLATRIVHTDITKITSCKTMLSFGPCTTIYVNNKQAQDDKFRSDIKTGGCTDDRTENFNSNYNCLRTSVIHNFLKSLNPAYVNANLIYRDADWWKSLLDIVNYQLPPSDSWTGIAQDGSNGHSDCNLLVLYRHLIELH